MGARSSSSELEESSEEVIYPASGYESREGEEWRVGTTFATYSPKRAAKLALIPPEVTVSVALSLTSRRLNLEASLALSGDGGAGLGDKCFWMARAYALLVKSSQPDLT